MKKNNKKSKNRSQTKLGERNLSIRLTIINSFNLYDEAFYKKYFCDRETLFLICLPSFKKITRERHDIKFISLYLSNLKKLTQLLKSINEDNNNNNSVIKNFDEKNKYFKLLKYVSENINYEKYSARKMIMRFGDKGDKYYIVLHGLVSVLTPIKLNMKITFYEYCRYIALLILYQEYELAKMAMRENKHIYNIDLPDIRFIIQYLNKSNEEEAAGKDENINKSYYLYSRKNIKSSKNIIPQKFNSKLNADFLSTIKKEDKNKQKFINVEKMIENENATKIDKFMSKYLKRSEFSLYQKMKERDEDSSESEKDEEITPDEYINRIQNFLLNNRRLSRKQSNKNFRKNIYSRKNASKDLNIIYNEDDSLDIISNSHKNRVYIYEYQEITQLETGEMFGDTALNTNTAKRTATVISVTDSYFGCLNKNIYVAIKGSNDKYKKNMANYLCHTAIFKSINYKIIEDKYLHYFAFKDAVKNEVIIQRGKINTNIIIIKNGAFEISFQGKLKDVFDLMNYYGEKFSDLYEKKYEISDFLLRKIFKLNENIRKIEKLFGDEKDIVYDLKLFLINSSSIFGLRDTEKKESEDKYSSFVDIKCVSSESQYVLLGKRIFYKQLYATDYKVKEETKFYVKEFVEKTINRLVHILYSKIWAILTKNNMELYKSIKKLSNEGDENKKNSGNLMAEIGLDFRYMNQYNLTDIECIVDKVLYRYNEDMFDKKNTAIDLYNYCETKKLIMAQEKNTKKLDEEKFQSNKFNSLIKQLRTKQKKHYTKLINFKRHNSIDIRRNSQIIKNMKNSNLNLIKYKNNNKDNDIEKKNAFTTNKIMHKFEWEKSYFSDKKNKELRPKSVKNKNFISRNFLKKRNNLSKNFSSGFSQGKTMDSYFSDVDMSCNYLNFNNAYISKLNYSIKNGYSPKNEILLNEKNKMKFNNMNFNINLIDQKMNSIFGASERYKSNFIRCFSSKQRYPSKLSFFDSSKQSKDLYIEQRKEYVLKNTRALFTRNKNFVQYKRRRKKENKNV